MIVTLVRRVAPAWTDVYGDPYDAPFEVREVIPEAMVAPTTTDDLAAENRAGTSTRRDVYLPADMIVEPTDLFDIDGIIFTIDGTPSDWENGLTGWHAGVVVHVTRVDG